MTAKVWVVRAKESTVGATAEGSWCWRREETTRKRTMAQAEAEAAL